MEKIKQLVEDIIEYTRTWSLTETEWYWNIECVRKPNNINDKEITWEKFETAIREEILYDLIYNNGSGLYNQMENDLCNYETDYVAFQNASKELEQAQVMNLSLEESIDYESMTVVQLRELAKERGLTGYSSLNKADLIQLLKDNE